MSSANDYSRLGAVTPDTQHDYKASMDYASNPDNWFQRARERETTTMSLGSDLEHAAQTAKHAPDQLDRTELRPLLLRALDRVALTEAMRAGEVTVRRPYPEDNESDVLVYATITFPISGQDTLTEFYLMMAGD